MLSPI
jgi:hypothetical protein